MFTRGESPPKSSILWFVYGRPFCWLQLSPLPDVTPKRIMVTKEHPATKDATISLIWCDWSSCDCRNRGALLAVEDLSPLVLMNKGEHRFLEEENQYIHTNIFIQRHQHIYIYITVYEVYLCTHPTITRKYITRSIQSNFQAASRRWRSSVKRIGSGWLEATLGGSETWSHQSANEKPHRWI